MIFASHRSAIAPNSCCRRLMFFLFLPTSCYSNGDEVVQLLLSVEDHSIIMVLFCSFANQSISTVTICLTRTYLIDPKVGGGVVEHNLFMLIAYYGRPGEERLGTLKIFIADPLYPACLPSYIDIDLIVPISNFNQYWNE